MSGLTITHIRRAVEELKRNEMEVGTFEGVRVIEDAGKPRVIALYRQPNPLPAWAMLVARRNTKPLVEGIVSTARFYGQDWMGQ